MHQAVASFVWFLAVATARRVDELSLEADLRFISQNELLEGFSGEITEAVRQYKPDLEELKAVSKRFGAQIPQDVPLTRRGSF